MEMRVFCSTFAFVLIAGLIFPVPGAAVINGTVDSTHQAVGAVLGASVVCTGTLISADPPLGSVLTAASCLDSGPPTLFVIGNDYSAPESVAAVVDWNLHPLYNATTGEFDIAVLTVSGIGPSPSVIPVMTPIEDSLMPGIPFLLVGYGLTSYPSGTTTVRHRVSTFIESFTALTFYGGDASAGPCTGDFGAPAIVSTPTGERVAGTVWGMLPECNGSASFARVSILYDSFIAPASTGRTPIFQDGFETFLLPWASLDGVGFLCATPGCSLPDP